MFRPRFPGSCFFPAARRKNWPPSTCMPSTGCRTRNPGRSVFRTGAPCRIRRYRHGMAATKTWQKARRRSPAGHAATAPPASGRIARTWKPRPPSANVIGRRVTSKRRKRSRVRNHRTKDAVACGHRHPWEAEVPDVLSNDERSLTDAYWRAANYLSVGQIYLYDNPLLKEPLSKEHIKPRLLGHWGTTPGLNFLYVHLNRLINKYDLDMIYITGPGHGGPGLVANAYLEGTYSEVYPNISADEAGMKRLFTQFSFPGGIPSHVAPETPGSMHEGGELGYALSHAYGAAFDNPDLIVTCVVGDGEAETGALATSWHSNKFLNPATDGAVLPILHLNGYKIANPTILARIPHAELEELMRGYGYEPFTLEGDDPLAMHQKAAAVFDTMFDRIAAIQKAAREGNTERPRWPMLIMR